MSTRVAYAVVGLFVIVLGALLAYGAVWFSTDGISGETSKYEVFVSGSVSGLNVDSPVSYNGVRVGRVESIRLDRDNPQRVRLLLDIAADTPVKTDTVATLQMRGLTGIIHVNLRGGSPEAPAPQARPGRAYPVIQSRRPAFADLEHGINSLFKRLGTTSERLNRLLRPENRHSIERTLANVERLSGHLARQSETLAGGVADFNATLDNMRSASEQFPALLTRLNESAAGLGKMADELAKTGSTVRSQIDRTAPELDRFARQALPDAAALISELRRTAENLRQVSVELQQDPSVLLYGGAGPAPGPGE